MARQYDVDDSEWFEVESINGYAVFMGYLMMGVRGLGLLVITWTTVVLLGGFVSNLRKKDFWCLTGITLIQTAGVFNFILKEKIIDDTVHVWLGLVTGVLAMFSKDEEKRPIIFYVLVVIQALVFGVILCALGVVYMFGMYISAGVSIWRLIEHDFGDAGGANQRPALQVLYILAVAQGMLFGYKTIYGHVAGSRLANVVARDICAVDKELIGEYIEETVAGCKKNPSFASGRNFVTYGVNLMMEAKSNEGFIAGIKVLSGAIKVHDLPGVVVLAKYLLTRSDSPSAIIQRLLETVGPRSPYSRDIKEHVVTILDIIAPCIHLEQFPQAIECLCSVVDTSEESNQESNDKDYGRVELLDEYEKEYLKYYEHTIGSPDLFLGTLRKLLCQCLPCKREKLENGRKKIFVWAFDRLLIKAVNIIHKLVADEDNRGIIMRTCVSNTMLHKIAMFPTKFHRENHYPCVAYLGLEELQMLEQCWVLTEWLLVALTETSSPPLLPAATPVGEGQQRRRSEEIEEEVEEGGRGQLLVLRSMDGSALGSTIKRTIKCIFDCLECSATQKRQAIQILLHLSLDMSFIVEDSESSRRRLSWILLLILCSTRDDSKYWMVPSLTYRNNNCCNFHGIRRKAGEKLSEVLRDIPSEESANSSSHLALGDLKWAFFDGDQDISSRIHAIQIVEGLCCIDYTRYSEVKGFLVDAFPELVKETLFRWESITAERPERATDVEMGDVPQDIQDGCIDTQRRLRKALASLCYHGYIRNYNSMRDEFEAIASEICKQHGKSFEDFVGLLEQSM